MNQPLSLGQPHIQHLHEALNATSEIGLGVRVVGVTNSEEQHTDTTYSDTPVTFDTITDPDHTTTEVKTVISVRLGQTEIYGPDQVTAKASGIDQALTRAYPTGNLSSLLMGHTTKLMSQADEAIVRSESSLETRLNRWFLSGTRAAALLGTIAGASSVYTVEQLINRHYLSASIVGIFAVASGAAASFGTSEAAANSAEILQEPNHLRSIREHTANKAMLVALEDTVHKIAPHRVH